MAEELIPMFRSDQKLDLLESKNKKEKTLQSVLWKFVDKTCSPRVPEVKCPCAFRLQARIKRAPRNWRPAFFLQISTQNDSSDLSMCVWAAQAHLCAFLCALICVLSFGCFHTCAVLCVLSSMCAFICVLSDVCSPLSAFISVLAYVCSSCALIEGSLEAKLPTIWTDGKAQPGRNSDVEKESQKGEDKRRRKSEERRCRCAKNCEKVGKSRNTVFFPMFCGSGGSKSRLAKAAGAEPARQMKDEKLHTVVA